MRKLSTTSVIAGILLSGGMLTQEAGAQNIVVGIMVDQLRTDYLERMRPYFGENGFNRLIREGVYLTDVDFRNTVKDSPSGAAVIYTGAWPSYNGVASAQVYDPMLKRNVPVLSADPSKTRIELTPEHLRLSTIADELFINNGNLTRIYSLAGDPQTAVVTAGHAGTGALWIDESSGKWNIPAYYGSVPVVLANKNRTSPLSSRIASKNWRPLHGASHYSGGGAWNPGDFNYSFSGGNRDAITRFKYSALANEELTDAAIDLLKSMRAGASEDHPGMLNIEYSLAPYRQDYDGDNRPELIDAYVRLDSQLERLIDAISKEYGKGNALIFLSSTGYALEPEIPETEAKLPTGEITLKKAESLLNSYLSATYGNGDFVLQIKNGKLYLDKKEAERKGLDINRLRKDTKEFLLRMGGISEVYTIEEILHSDSRKAAEMALGVDPKNAPDLFLSFTPGWTLTDDSSYPSVSEKIRLATPPTPAFILSAEVEPEVVRTRIDATEIAPTISSLLRIRSPNGASSKPLSLSGKTKY